MRYKAILLDFGHTLASPYPSRAHQYVAACRDFGVKVTPEAITQARREVPQWDEHHTPLGPAHQDASRSEESYDEMQLQHDASVLRRLGIEGDVSDIAQRVHQYRNDPGFYMVYPDSVPALKSISEYGVPLGIISNTHWQFPKLLSDLGLAHFFDFVVASARAGFRKPHPRIFQEALGRLKAAPELVVYIGNNYDNDVVGARRVGMDACLIDRTGSESRPCATIATLAELPHLLENA